MNALFSPPAAAPRWRRWLRPQRQARSARRPLRAGRRQRGGAASGRQAPPGLWRCAILSIASPPTPPRGLCGSLRSSRYAACSRFSRYAGGHFRSAHLPRGAAQRAQGDAAPYVAPSAPRGRRCAARSARCTAQSNPRSGAGRSTLRRGMGEGRARAALLRGAGAGARSHPAQIRSAPCTTPLSLTLRHGTEHHGTHDRQQSSLCL